LRVLAIDAGATKVSGALVDKIDKNTFKLNEPAIEIQYKDHPKFNANFSTATLEDQYHKLKIEKLEIQQGNAYMDCTIELIKQFTSNTSLKIGIATAGIKDMNNRGVIIMANGPRMPEYLNYIESKITQSIYPLESDANMCIWGEEYEENGSLRNIKNAYYLGGGTGTADGLKLKNKLISFDQISNWIAKTIELKTSNGESLEEYTSMSGINKLINRLTSHDIGKIIGELLFERISTIYSGWDNQYQIDRSIISTHPYLNVLLDQIIIGQKLSTFLQSKIGHDIYNSIISELKDQCSIANPIVKAHFIKNENFMPKRILLSDLREAPIIGMGAKVWMENC
jgi:predicted NBD/HSP70 family sugar kinase